MLGRQTKKGATADSVTAEFQRLQDQIKAGKWGKARSGLKLMRFAEQHFSDYERATDEHQQTQLYRLIVRAALRGRTLLLSTSHPS